MRPRKVVELGAYNGMSFFAFCQSMIDNDVSGLCYAVDTWGGDDHTGGYDNSIFEDVRHHARENYRGISYLLRMLFNDALPHFEDESIDLLHIDGLHTYEAVQEDFTNWYPKVTPGGIILFHDIEARQSDFGVWKFWSDWRRSTKPSPFATVSALAFCANPAGRLSNRHTPLELLFNGTESEQSKLRQLYIHNSEYLEARNQARRMPPNANQGGDGKNKGNQKPQPEKATD